MAGVQKNGKLAPRVRIGATSQPPIPPCTLHHQLRSMLVDTKMTLRHCAQLLGLSTTTLRVEATRLGLQVSTRPKVLTQARLGALRAALVSTTTLKILAQRHVTSVVSLYRILRMHPDVASARDKLIMEQKRDIKRKRFSLGCRNTFVRKLPDYPWLYKHDRKWLGEMIATTLKRKAFPATRIDWKKRDQAFSTAVMKHSQQLYTTQKPVRVTKASIGRSMRKLSILEKHLLRLPLTAQALAENVESTENFQCRRLRWAALQVRQYHPTPSSWMLLRVAGLRSAGTGEVSKVLDELINEAQADVIQKKPYVPAIGARHEFKRQQ